MTNTATQALSAIDQRQSGYPYCDGKYNWYPPRVEPSRKVKDVEGISKREQMYLYRKMDGRAPTVGATVHFKRDYVAATRAAHVDAYSHVNRIYRPRLTWGSFGLTERGPMSPIPNLVAAAGHNSESSLLPDF